MQWPRAIAIVPLLLTCACVSEAAVNQRPQSGTAVASEVDGVQQVVIRSGVDLRFSPSTIVVHQGPVRFILVNTAKAGAGPPHDLQVSKLPRANVPLATAGHTQAVTFEAPAPGTYDFVCSIHARQGQTGRLIVR